MSKTEMQGWLAQLEEDFEAGRITLAEFRDTEAKLEALEAE